MTRDQKIALKLKAHEILMKANMGKSGDYTKEIASKAAYESILAMPSDCRDAFLQKIVDGDERMIDLYRWPLKPSKHLLTMLYLDGVNLDRNHQQ